MVAHLLKIEGLVQGIGFRPYVFRLANSLGLTGYVRNTNEGVEILVQGETHVIENFIRQLEADPPRLAEFRITTNNHVPVGGCNGFMITGSDSPNQQATFISPDLAVCQDCLVDLKTQEHRKDYPLINCVQCGPRFSIIRNIPYDRPNTTMAPFAMCSRCSREYNETANRRFHAQPVSCNYCGPVYHMKQNEDIIQGSVDIIHRLATLLNKDGVVALKGTGGYHLVCNALSEKAVKALREIKHRDAKPFALMFRDMATLEAYAHVSAEETALLISWQRPVVILKVKKPLGKAISSGLCTYGAILPYMPFHHLIFEQTRFDALVFTSCNLHDEPVLIADDEVSKTFGPRCNAIIAYNREIYNRCDDSVCRVIAGKGHILRRSRGYVPLPISLGHDSDGILALGGEMGNTFCIGKGQQAILSQHIGDLKNSATFDFYTQTIERFSRLFRFTPRRIVCDLHPDYLTTRYALEMGLETQQVQHHHAHILSGMAEHRLTDPVIGVAFDGTGFGTDGHVWGSEFLVTHGKDFTRHYHFDYIELPGGDRATAEPWRMAVSYLYRIYGRELTALDLPFISRIEENQIAGVLTMLEKGMNCPLSSSAGRLFDAVAALLGVCLTSTFTAKAPQRLESMIVADTNERYEVGFQEAVSFSEMIQQIVYEIRDRRSRTLIATKFHNTLIYVIFKAVFRISKETGIKRVVLSGGVFQNKYIAEKTEKLLLKNGFDVYQQCLVPCNDGGLALGQLLYGALSKST